MIASLTRTATPSTKAAREMDWSKNNAISEIGNRALISLADTREGAKQGQVRRPVREFKSRQGYSKFGGRGPCGIGASDLKLRFSFDLGVGFRGRSERFRPTMATRHFLLS